MKTRRIQRVNSLIKEILAEIILKEVKNPHIPPLITVKGVDTSADLHCAKVYVSFLQCTDAQKAAAMKALAEAAGFIAAQASKRASLRYFPTLTFYEDQSTEDYLRIDALLQEIHRDTPDVNTP